MTSEIRANTLKNRVGLGTISFTNTGAVVSGIVTANSFSGTGDLDVDGHTELDNTNIVGIVTVTNVSSGIGLKLIDSSSKQFFAGGGGGGTPFVGSFSGHDFRIQVGGNQNAIFKYAAGSRGNFELGPSSGIGITFNGATGNAGYAGIVTATTFVGNFTGTSSGNAVLTGSTNNTLVTVTGANAITGEANLTWDGSVLSATGSDAQLRLYDSTASSENSALRMMAYNGVNHIQSGKAFSSDSKADLIFGSMFGGTEWLRITTTGEIKQYGFTGTSDTASDDLVLGNTTDGVNRGITIWSHSSQNGSIAFADNDSNFRGAVQYIHNGDRLRFLVAGDERLSIKDNRVNIGDTYQTGTDLTYCRLNVYGQTSQSGTDKNLNLLNVYNYGSGNPGNITGIGLGAGASPDYTKASLAFVRNDSYGRGDLIFCINSAGNSDLVTETDEHLRLTKTGALALGQSPTSLPQENSGHYHQLQIGLGAHFVGRTDDTSLFLGSNAHRYGTAWRYTANTTASLVSMGTNIEFYTAAAGTALNTISFTQRLKLGTSGKHGINNGSPQYAMHLSPADGQSRIDLHMTNSTTGGGAADGVQFGYQNTYGAYIWNFENTPIYFGTNNIKRLLIETSSNTTFNFRPETNNVCSLGTNSYRWANIHTNDLNLSNEGSVNEVDGTWGQYTIQEGQDDLFLINRRSGKKYKFLLQEVN